MPVPARSPRHDGQFPAVVQLQRHHLALAEVAAGGDATCIDAIRQQLASPLSPNSEHMRLARHILAGALDRLAPLMSMGLTIGLAVGLSR